MPTVDLAFAVLATEPIPADHGYHLYGALSRILPQLECLWRHRFLPRDLTSEYR